MAGAPPPMTFAPLQFAQGGGMGDVLSKLQGLSKMAPGAANAIQGALAPSPVAPGAAVPGAQGPTSVGGPAGPAPLNPVGPTSVGGQPLGPAPQPSGILDAIRGMTPQQILDSLRAMSQRGTSLSAGLPGSAALGSAGLIPGG